MPSLPKPRLRRPGRTRLSSGASNLEPDTRAIELVEANGLRWINIERPRTSDRAWLEERFDFHPLDYEDVFSRNQRPKIDQYDGYLFIVLHFPRYDKQAGRLGPSELDVFVGPDFLITLPNPRSEPIEYLFERCRADDEMRGQWFARGSGYLLYKVLDGCVDAGFPMLAKMGNKLERVEDDIFAGLSKEVVHDISDVKQEIINFRKIIRPQRAVIADLERSKQRYMTSDLDVYFDDINDASERIWQMLEGYKETVEALEATNESVLSHQLNDVLRVLTVLSVVFLPLTLISGIWGMNVRVPGEGTVSAFWIVVGVMLVLLVGMLAFFRRRGWL